MEPLYKCYLHGSVHAALLAACVLWAVSFIATKVALETLTPYGAATVMGAACMAPVGVAALAASPGWYASGRAWAALGFLGVGCSFLATCFYCLALEKMESQKVGVYLYTIPPMTYGAAGLLLGERLGLNLAAGTVLVIGGVVLTERG